MGRESQVNSTMFHSSIRRTPKRARLKAQFISHVTGLVRPVIDTPILCPPLLDKCDALYWPHLTHTLAIRIINRHQAVFVYCHPPKFSPLLTRNISTGWPAMPPLRLELDELENRRQLRKR